MSLRFCILLLACSGCASAPAQHSGAASDAASRPALRAGAAQCTPVNTLELQGRLSVRYESAEGKQQSLQANFNWRQAAGQIQILLSNPLGQGMAEVKLSAQGAQFTDQQGQQHHAADADSLSEKLLGWPLPVAGLRDWLRGCGQQADGAAFTATPHSDASFASADGWRIRYAAWHEDGRPKRIDLERHINQQAADVSLRILLDAS